MTALKQPLVSVVTPVYNGEKYLAECIESVLNQSYQNWEYVIVNNCSKDRTREIAQQYAKKDDRIRVHDNETFLAVIANWNHALRQMSPASKYCKVVHADDWLFPECLERMVAVAEQYPSVGIVAAYVLWGKRVEMSGLPYPSTFVPGREVCRGKLRGECSVFGTPSSILMRADLIRRRSKFYNEDNFHADHETCYELLQDSDFGFVHQVLTYNRVHDESQTATVTDRYDTIVLNNLRMLKRYGPIYLEKDEFQKYMKQALNIYYWTLARNLVRAREKEYWVFQQRELEKCGFKFSPARLASATSGLLFDKAFNPKSTLEKIVSLLEHRHH